MSVLIAFLKLAAFFLLLGILLLAGGLIANRPPLFDSPGPVVRLKTYLTTNVAETQADSLYPELRQPRYPVPPDLLFDAAQRAAQNLGWRKDLVDAEQREIRAVVVTPFWRFRDHVVIRISPISASESTLSVRSSSEIGKGDLGANTRHVLDLLQMIDSILQAKRMGIG
jgi:uncharacterized protein (DUF1499 family)